jgi:hypothetical protein
MAGPNGNHRRHRRARFSLGRTMITAGARRELPEAEVLTALGWHVRGDWGDVDDEDWEANERALKEGTRLVSVYRSSGGVKFYIITEWDRSLTTVLLPEEY